MHFGLTTVQMQPLSVRCLMVSCLIQHLGRSVDGLFDHSKFLLSVPNLVSTWSSPSAYQSYVALCCSKELRFGGWLLFNCPTKRGLRKRCNCLRYIEWKCSFGVPKTRCRRWSTSQWSKSRWEPFVPDWSCGQESNLVWQAHNVSRKITNC